jgi:hypothetical protein
VPELTADEECLWCGREELMPVE